MVFSGLGLCLWALIFLCVGFILEGCVRRGGLLDAPQGGRGDPQQFQDDTLPATAGTVQRELLFTVVPT